MCRFYGATFSKRNMRGHLDSCKERKIRNATTGRTKFFHIVVEGEGASEYWLHLDVRANSKLEELDRFLREIWLERYGHLSAFTINGESYYCAAYIERPNEPTDKGMNFRLEEVLTPGTKFKHEYDFGTTTLRLRVVSERMGKWRKEANTAYGEKPSSKDKMRRLRCRSHESVPIMRAKHLGHHLALRSLHKHA